DFRLYATLKPESLKRIGDGAVQQNIQILRNRVNELGVAEPIVQQQGSDRIQDAQPGFDSRNNEPIVSVTLDATGGRIIRDISRENIGKGMGILLIDKNKTELITAPKIRD